MRAAPANRPAPGRKAHALDARRILAFAGSVLLHLVVLLALCGDTLETPPPLRARAIEVRLIDDARGRAAGPPMARAQPRMPSAAPARVDSPRIAASHVSRASAQRRVSPAQPAVLEVARVPPPAIETAKVAPDGFASDTATLAQAQSGTPGAAGSGRNGHDLAGSMRRIALLKRVAPSLPYSLASAARGTWALLAVRVDSSGHAREIRVLRSSGLAEADFAAREAALASAYAPHVRDGKPVAFWGLLPFVFGDADANLDIEGALAAAGFEHT